MIHTWLIQSIMYESKIEERNNKMTISHPQSGDSCKILPHEVRVIVRKVAYQPRTTWEEPVNDLRAVGTTATKSTIGNTLDNGQKSSGCRKVPMLKKAHLQAHVKFANEDVSRKKYCGQVIVFVFERREMLHMTLRASPPQSSTEM